jgi:Fic family protein
VINVHRALIWLDDFIASGKPISEETILELHTIVMDHILDNDAGAYRRQPVRVAGSPHIPPNWMTVPTAMRGLIERLSQGPGSEDPITFAARAHIELASIHPFIDGNGRVIRLLVNLVLMRSGYLPAMYCVSERTEYISALGRADTEGDDTAL